MFYTGPKHQGCPPDCGAAYCLMLDMQFLSEGLTSANEVYRLRSALNQHLEALISLCPAPRGSEAQRGLGNRALQAR